MNNLNLREVFLIDSSLVRLLLGALQRAVGERKTDFFCREPQLVPHSLRSCSDPPKPRCNDGHAVRRRNLDDLAKPDLKNEWLYRRSTGFGGGHIQQHQPRDGGNLCAARRFGVIDDRRIIERG